jgi:hypothetical protein
MHTIPRLLALLTLAAPAAAAVLTVGPTGQFAEISDAIAAAQPDDVILVAPGTYQRFEVAKPLTILGDGTGDVIVTSLGLSGVVISGIAAGAEVVVSGLDVRANPIFDPSAASVFARDCAGTVTLHDLTIDYEFNLVGVHVERCDRVLLLASAIPKGGPPAAVRAIDSELWLVDCTIAGKKGVSGFAEPGPDGVRLVGSTLRVWRSAIQGGDAATGKPSFFVAPDGGDGIDAIGSTLALYGGPGTGGGSIAGGDGELGAFLTPNGVGGHGVRLSQSSSADVQQALPITGGLDGANLVVAPSISTDGSSSAQSLAAVFPTLFASAPTTAAGGSLSLGIEGSASSIAVLFVSFGTGPTLSLPGIEGVGVLDPTLFVQLAVTGLDGAGAATIHAAVPPTPALLGITFWFQAAEAAGVQLAITNPALAAVTQ